MSCIGDDKGGLLQNCFDWILQDKQLKDWQENQDTRLLWIKGDPGKGKTMLMIGLVKDLTARLTPHKNCALAFFFCQNAEPHLNNAVSALRGLIWKLLSRNPALGNHIPEEYRFKSKEKRKAMFEDLSPNIFSTLKTMLNAILRDAHFKTIYLLVDALDECGRDLDRLVEFMSQNAADPLSKAKWLVSGRSNIRLDRSLRRKCHQQKITLELNDEHISRAVTLFIELKVDDLAKNGEYSPELRRQVREKLEAKAESTFLWVALVCKQLGGVPRLTVMTELDKFPPGLPGLYERMMQLIEDQGDDIGRLCKQVLRTVAVAYRPLMLDELAPMAELHEESTEDIGELVNLCSSYLILREKTIRFLHQSAKDYLDRHKEIFPDGRAEGHRTMLSRSLESMPQSLRRDIYNLHHPGFSIDEVKTPDLDPLASIRYACVYWVDHLADYLQKSSRDISKYYDFLSDEGNVKKFLLVHLLHWLEALSLIGKTSEGILAIISLEALILVSLLYNIIKES
jgi:hypothetical protein